jgi:Tfp pilus assembly protein PilX
MRSTEQQEVPMSTGAIVAIIVVLIVVAAVAAFATGALRRYRLRRRFGAEYDRAVAETGSQRQAEAELAERERRVRSLDIRTLDAPALDRYIREWNTIQEQFVDAPAKSVVGAQRLITAVMKDRGYPTESTDQIMSDLSVDYASTLQEFRTAQELSGRAASGSATTEDLRQAMVHYRSLFRDLLGEPAGIGARSSASEAATSDSARSESATATPPGTGPAESVSADASTNGADAPSPASAAQLSQER